MRIIGLSASMVLAALALAAGAVLAAPHAAPHATHGAPTGSVAVAATPQPTTTVFTAGNDPWD